ncbi:class I SAM-dependent methyltransferase [Actinokineospora enzanensis]|uniref:class I SAM-dependent methyltransferase n=1 Tax=Actinokineospora enzanensis TaxID=155975 RepID=UPI00036069BD|nr:class I SAM-dependent methyltransferase [Actinokineospora enzanensis]
MIDTPMLAPSPDTLSAETGPAKTVPAKEMPAHNPVTETFNSALATAALSAAWEVGLLDRLHVDGPVSVEKFAVDHDLHAPTLLAVVRALAARRIVVLDGRGHAEPGPGFADAFRTKGFFHWLVRGCGELLTANLPALAHNDRRDDAALRRDSRAISVACRDIARNFFDPPFHDLLAGLDFDTAADLGCGSGDRVLGMLAGRPHARGIGIDIAKGALSVAREAVDAEGLGDRVTLHLDDALALSARPEYAAVDLVTCFMMGHDFWPMDQCVRTLRGLREVFPNARSLVLGDTCRSTGLDADFPMFTLGFELVHAAMGQFVPTLDEWHAAFDQAGWLIADRRMIDLPPYSFVYHLRPA